MKRLATLKAAEQRREVKVAQAAHERAPNDTKWLGLALALLLARAHWRDNACIQFLLGGIEAAPHQPHSAHYDLAQLLPGLLSGRQLAQCDEQRKADQVMLQLREERLKTEAMQHKIASLRAIDREMGMQRKAP